MNRATTKSGRLTEEQKAFVVSSIACFEPLSHVHAALLKRWPGLQMTQQGVDRYNPNCLAGKKLAKKWKALFDATRTAYLQDCAAHGVAHRAYRLQTLQQILDDAMARKNYPMATGVLEQAAKEVGDVFTNRSKVENTGGLALIVSREDAAL